MSICKQQQIHNFCHPNAIMTLAEYLEDYAKPDTKKVGEKLISKELQTIDDSKIKSMTEKYLEKIKSGERDFRF